MSFSEPRSAAGLTALQRIIERPGETLVGVDFDGTLAPIVDNPENAYADEAAITALGRIGNLVGAVVVITGRPARTAVRLGRFQQTPGLERMVVLGQYGVERWNAATDDYQIPPEPEAITSVLEEMPAILDDLGLRQARIEHKGRAVGVHTRELGDAGVAFSRLEAPMEDLAARHGLLVEPGKNVLEIRAPGFDKGEALRSIVEETGCRGIVFAGDDLGDLPAFRMVEQLRTEGYAGLLICSASHEEDALADLSDVVVEGAPGVGAWLSELADRIEAGKAG